MVFKELSMGFDFNTQIFEIWKQQLTLAFLA